MREVYNFAEATCLGRLRRLWPVLGEQEQRQRQHITDYKRLDLHLLQIVFRRFSGFVEENFENPNLSSEMQAPSSQDALIIFVLSGNLGQGP